MHRLSTVIISLTLVFSAQMALAGPPTSLVQSTGTHICDSFNSALLSSKQSTLDSFLKELVRKPDFANGVSAKAALYHSRAKHGSTLQDPRALIMFGMGDLVLAFNGAKDEAFYDTLEIMCYNRNTSRFEFRAIQFSGDSQPTSVNLAEIELQNSPYFNVSKANPSTCAECHGSETTKPVWETYLAWGGSFGSYEEAFALPRARFAHEDQQTEYTNLSAFQKAALLGKERYRNFSWGKGQPSLATVNDALFGILVNYKMSNPAIRAAAETLRLPSASKYKYAFAGYLLNCSANSFLPHDTVSDLDSYMTKFISERASFELSERMNLNQDLANVGETLRWVDAVIYPQNLDSSIVDLSRASSGVASMVIRTSLVTRDWIFKLARLENLYNKIGLSTSALHLGQSKTSWDGYNEIQDYMSDYLLKYYGLPLITPIQKRQVETSGPRGDLDTTLSDEDYQSAYTSLAALQLPAIQNGDRVQLCADLSKASLSLLSKSDD